MSENIGNFTKDLVEDAMSSAVELSAMNSAPEIPCEPNNQPDLKPLSNILEEVAQLAKNLQQGLENVQIGDYQVSLTNASPLEIQLKRAITNIEVTPIEQPLKIIIKGGDFEVKEDSLVENDTLTVNQSDTISTEPNSEMINQPNEIISTASLPRDGKTDEKMKMTFGRRLRKLFKIGRKSHQKKTSDV